jgi:hypothetical protein
MKKTLASITIALTTLFCLSVPGAMAQSGGMSDAFAGADNGDQSNRTADRRSGTQTVVNENSEVNAPQLQGATNGTIASTPLVQYASTTWPTWKRCSTSSRTGWKSSESRGADRQ